jgi:transposase
MLINAFRAHLAQLGLVAAKGPAGVTVLTARVEELATSQAWPAPMIAALRSFVDQLRQLDAEIDRL